MTNLKIWRDREHRFHLQITGAASVEEVKEELDAGEKFIGFVPLDLEDSGVRAIAAVLELAAGASDGLHKVGAETLMLQIFCAGYNSAEPEC